MDTVIIGIVYDLIFAALLVSAALLGAPAGLPCLADSAGRQRAGHPGRLLGGTHLRARAVRRTFQRHGQPAGDRRAGRGRRRRGCAGGRAGLFARRHPRSPHRPRCPAPAARPAPYAAEALAPLILPLVQALLFLVVYLVLRALVRLVAAVLRHFNDLPILGGGQPAAGPCAGGGHRRGERLGVHCWCSGWPPTWPPGGSRRWGPARCPTASSTGSSRPSTPS